MSRLPVSGAVLEGGASSRLGRDKAGIRWNGVPAGERTAALLDTCAAEVLRVGAARGFTGPGRLVPDGEGPRCALRGVIAALEHADHERVWIVATDLPGLRAELLLALAALPEADAVLPITSYGPQPLCGLYRRVPALAAARARWSEQRLSLRGWLDDLSQSALEGAALEAVDPTGNALLNVNTPADLAAAREQLGLRADAS